MNYTLGVAPRKPLHSFHERLIDLKHRGAGAGAGAGAVTGTLPECLANTDVQNAIQRELGLDAACLGGLYCPNEAFDETVSAPRAAHRETELARALERANDPVVQLSIALLLNGFGAELDAADAALAGLPYQAAGAAPNVILASVVESLADDVMTLTADTLSNESAFAEREGFLEALPPQKQVAAYSELIANPEYVAYLFDKYPLIIARTHVRIELVVASMAKLVRRLAADRDELAASLGVDIAQFAVRAIRRGTGDSHHGADSVSLLHLVDGRTVVYKPRDVSPEAAFGRFLGWLAEQDARFSQHSPWVLCREGYGWMEFVAVASLPPGKAAAFYYRYGVLMGAVFALNGTDIHHENLIAHGEFPVVVDLETILQPIMLRGNEDSEPSYLLDLEFFVNSPLYTAMVDPAFLGKVNDGGPLALKPRVDLGGWDAVEPAEGGGFRIEQPRILASASNLVRDGERIVDFTDFIEDILRGFGDLYDFLLQRKIELLGSRIDELASGVVIRVIFKPTAKYSNILSVSHSAYAQESNFQFDEFIGKLWLTAVTKPAIGKIILSECEDIWCGDVPYFCAEATSDSLRDSRGRSIDGVLLHDGLKATRAKLATLSTETKAQDLSTLRYALLRKREQLHSADEPTGTLDGGPLAILKLLAHRILMDNGRGLYVDLVMGRDLVTRHRLLGGNLYTGMAGVIFAFAYAGEVDEELRAKARALANVYFSDLDLECESRIGVCDGLGSSLYLAAHLSALWSDTGLRAIAAILLAQIDKLIHFDRHFDLFTGAAGALVAALTARSVVGEDVARPTIQRLIAHLSKYAVRGDGSCSWLSSIPSHGATTGFAHGVSGIAHALVLAQNVEPSLHLEEMILECHRFLESCRVGDGKWAEDQSRKDAKMDVWCHGALGVGLFYLYASRTRGGEFESRFREAFATMTQAYVFDNDSLCHGTQGNLELFLGVLEDERYADLHDIARELVDAATAEMSSRDPRCGNKYRHHSLSLFNGFSGIAYQGFRARGHAWPSVLAFAGVGSRGH